MGRDPMSVVDNHLTNGALYRHRRTRGRDTEGGIIDLLNPNRALFGACRLGPHKTV
jgi:hypothetical protein